MNIRTRNLYVAGTAVLALGWPVPALADCVDTRKPTAAEIDFHSRGIAALAAALPPLPVGATLHRKDGFSTIGSNQCVGKTGDFSLDASREYQHNGRWATMYVSMNVARVPVLGTGPSGVYGAESPGRSAGLKVHNVVWYMSGSDSPLRKTLAEAMDRERLQGLVGKPLPSVAQSQALAAQAVPATVPAVSIVAPATAAGSTTTPAAQPVAAPAGQPAAPDPMRDTLDTVNRLRGLFGR
jgi:hypothetical protein